MNAYAGSPDSLAGPSYRIRPIVAWRALRTLLRDPEDTAQVFTIVRALSGRSLRRGFQRFSASDAGRAVINQRRELLDALDDRAHLGALPAGSLGRVYLEFMQAQNITATGLVDASTHGPLPAEPDLARYARRLRDMHDLWHVVTGYRTDTSGEVCLLGFTFAQTRNPGLAFIAVMGAGRIARDARRAKSGERRIFRALWEGYRSGRRAAWLPAADWEDLLSLHVEEARASLGIAPPEVYRSLHARA